MPAEFSAITQLFALIERGGVSGVLFITVAWLIWERLRLVKQGAKTFRQRDKARQIAERYRTTITAAGMPLPSIDDIEAQFAQDKED